MLTQYVTVVMLSLSVVSVSVTSISLNADINSWAEKQRRRRTDGSLSSQRPDRGTDRPDLLLPTRATVHLCLRSRE